MHGVVGDGVCIPWNTVVGGVVGEKEEGRGGGGG